MPSIASMTGYFAADGMTPAGTVTVECRSVNSRFLDLTLRLDDTLRFAEPAIRERLQSASRAAKLKSACRCQPMNRRCRLKLMKVR